MFSFMNDYSRKRDLALLRATQLIIEANPNPVQYVKIAQNSFIRTLSVGLSRNNPLFTKKAESMSFLEMTSILRKCSNFGKRSIAETMSAAFAATDKSQESRELLLKIAFECDIPRNYLRL